MKLLETCVRRFITSVKLCFSIFSSRGRAECLEKSQPLLSRELTLFCFLVVYCCPSYSLTLHYLFSPQIWLFQLLVSCDAGLWWGYVWMGALHHWERGCWTELGAPCSNLSEEWSKCNYSESNALCHITAPIPALSFPTTSSVNQPKMETIFFRNK